METVKNMEHHKSNYSSVNVTAHDAIFLCFHLIVLFSLDLIVYSGFLVSAV